MKTKQTAWCLVMAFVAVPLASVRTFAASETSTSTEEPEVILSPFSVQSTRDYGYISTNSQSGGRLSTKLRNTPVSISVLNSELLSDLGAFGLQDARKWAPNSYAATESDVNPEGGGQVTNGFSETGFGGTSVRVRGIRQATLARNYFYSVITSDTYNTERLDVSRGPNALVFGDASLGGIVNVSTKRAQDWDFSRAQLQMSSYGGQGRLVLDVNRAVSQSLAVRITALRQRLDGWRDYLTNDRDGLYGTMTWRPSANTQIRIEGEWGRRDALNPTVFVKENASAWNHTATQDTVGQKIVPGTGLVAATGVQLDLSHLSLGVTPLTGLALTDSTYASPITPFLSSFYTTLAPAPVDEPAKLDGKPTAFVTPRFSYAVRNIGTRLRDQFSAVSAYLEQQVGDSLFFEVAGSVQHDKADVFLPFTNRLFFDVNRVLPTGVTLNGSNLNPDFLTPFTLEQVRDQANLGRSVEARASGVYEWKSPWFRQQIGLMGSFRRTDSDVRYFKLVRTNGTNPDLTDISNTVSVKAPLTQRSLSWLDFEPGRSYTFNGSDLAFENYAYPGQALPRANDSEVDSIQISAAGDWLPSSRIHSIAGVRRDYYTGRRYQTAQIDPVSKRVLSISRTSRSRETLTSPSVGAVFDVLRNVGLYANSSKTFAVNSGAAPTFTGEPIPTRIGSGIDAGLKFSLMEGRISGSVAYYKTKEINNVVTSPIGNINRILSTIYPVNPPQFGSTADSQTATATGLEMEVLANLTRNWTLLVNAGRPKSELRNGVPYTRKYVADNRADWIAKAAAIGGKAPATVATSLVAQDNFIAGFRDGAQVSSVRDYTANVFTRYRFSTGPAKGAFVGIGANFYGQSYLGYNNVLQRDVFGGAFHLYSALAGYSRKFHGVDTTLQVNVSNLLNDSNFSAVGGFLANGMPNSFRVSAPRELRASATIKF